MKQLLLQVEDEDRESPVKNIDHPEDELVKVYVMKGAKRHFGCGSGGDKAEVAFIRKS